MKNAGQEDFLICTNNKIVDALIDNEATDENIGSENDTKNRA